MPGLRGAVEAVGVGSGADIARRLGGGGGASAADSLQAQSLHLVEHFDAAGVLGAQ
ncbi:hypothetical protein AB0B89_29275 [Sphaerisporangium sp. NPDC049002]|uniref:hypothetical protein n=1 Tax=Sphaerisporangium sp. NPDC049002 TaxID=3155392 RepID=UPI00340031E4